MNDKNIPISGIPTQDEPALESVAEKSGGQTSDPVSEPAVEPVDLPNQEPSTRERAAQKPYMPRYDKPTRRPSSLRPASFNPLAWVADGVTGAIEEVRHNDLGLSEAFWTHLYATRRESLLTAKALVDSLLDKVESKSAELDQKQQQRKRRGGVDINF